jgi:hypothetical protein
MSPATVGSGTAAGPDGQAGPAEAPPATTNRHGGQASDHPAPLEQEADMRLDLRHVILPFCCHC